MADEEELWEARRSIAKTMLAPVIRIRKARELRPKQADKGNGQISLEIDLPKLPSSSSHYHHCQDHARARHPHPQGPRAQARTGR
jgi:hypothetical protein